MAFVVHGKLPTLLLGMDEVAKLANIHVFMRLIVKTARFCVPQCVLSLNRFADTWRYLMMLPALPFLV